MSILLIFTTHFFFFSVRLEWIERFTLGFKRWTSGNREGAIEKRC